MKASSFVRHVPETVEEAVRLLADLAPQDGRVLAGGQSLVPIMNFRLARPAYLIDINAVPGLNRLAAEDGILRIGALVRHAAFNRPVERVRCGRCWPLWSGISGIIQSGSAAPSAAALPMPIRLQNGAWL